MEVMQTIKEILKLNPFFKEQMQASPLPDMPRSHVQAAKVSPTSHTCALAIGTGVDCR